MLTLIIGSGPSGLFAAINAKHQNNEVLVIEKNHKPGKKLFITGKGRCNVTNDCSKQEFINHVVSNPKFLYSAINAFSSQDTIEFFTRHHTDLVIERGHRVFPKSYHSYDITDCLYKTAIDLGVKFHFNEKVLDIDKNIDSFIIKTDQNIYKADYLVIATGGLSYPSTGSDGDGYRFAKKLSHHITDLSPALVGMKINHAIPSSLYKKTLKNVSLIVITNNQKMSEFGEMTFYEDYIDGPIVITLSSYLNKISTPIELFLDLKPALNNEQLNERILREIKSNPKNTIMDLLASLLMRDFIPLFISETKLPTNVTLANMNKDQRTTLIKYLKAFPLYYKGLLGFERAIVTSGGVDIKEISSSTMESKLVKNLFFVGEVLDVDALTGGFNIQIALSTAYLAGNTIKKRIN